MAADNAQGSVTFLSQRQPIDERGRALYAIARSILRAQLDQLTQEDLEDLQRDRSEVTLRQLSKLARLDRDKGMRGDGFEWAVHEAVLGEEPSVIEPVADAMTRASKKFASMSMPTSLLFGYERAKYLGFLDAIVENADSQAVLLPDGSRGRPYIFDGPWMRLAARGQRSEPLLGDRIARVWKTDLFLSDESRHRHVAATIKSNHLLLESGPGLRLGIVPEAKDLPAGVRYRNGLWLVVLPDPNGFMGLFNDAYESVAEAVFKLGKHDRGLYIYKPTPQGQRITDQLIKYANVKVVEIEHALNEAAQQDLIGITTRLVPVDAPGWLHLNAARTPVLAPKPAFERLD
ncbi:Uncharacterised protein [Mycolicibacterium aurum]|uniref:Uncharacterized protein n=1 Tax=Mycolicibacterium aurum TaxID=1791 RepID=A0A3S4TFQ5_MYCAU|nr:hypothetical protein [Mycolicibacterium aurum]VEG58151.1 Uncharacterised protein [Mycolicibacterium aurum]